MRQAAGKEWSKQPSAESLKLEDFERPKVTLKPELLLAKIGSKVAANLDKELCKQMATSESSKSRIRSKPRKTEK